MKLALQILLKSIQLIFAEPLRTLRVVAPGAALYVLGGILFVMGVARNLDSEVAYTTGDIALVLLAICVLTIGAMTFAIFWHRYALLTGDERGTVTSPGTAVFGQYFKGLLVIVLVIFVVAFFGSIAIAAIGFILSAALGTIGAVVLGLASLGIWVAIAWIAFRISLILPAAALGHRMGYRESWEATRSVGRDLFVLMILLFVVSIIIQLAVSGVGFVLPFVSVILAVLQGAFGALLYVSVLSTLYGHLVQGRPLT